MADLVTHACSVLLPGAFVRSRYVPVATLGAVLPDALGRAVPMGLEVLLRLGVPIPEPALYPWAALHVPAGAVPVCVLVSFAFAERVRGAVLGALLVGYTLHLALDLFQDHHGEGYLLLAPFSIARFELGWIGSEATVELALPLLALTGLAWAGRIAVMRFLPLWLAACGDGPGVVGAGPDGTDDPGPTEVPQVPLELCVNEIAPAAARSGAADWIELFAPGPEDVPLARWTVADAGGNRELFADGAVVPAVGALLVADLPFALDADGDEVVLYAPDGRTQTVRFGGVSEDVALARTSDCCVGDCWTETWLGSPGRSNGRPLLTVEPTTFAGTTELRIPFQVDDPLAIEVLELVVSAADGARVSLGDVEVLRVGLPSGAIDASTAPLAAVPPATVRIQVDPAVLVAGENTLAADVRAVATGTFSATLHARGSLPTVPAPTQPVTADETVATEPDPSASVFAHDRIHEVEITLTEEAFDLLDAEVGTYVNGLVTVDGSPIAEAGIKRRGKLGSLRSMTGKPKLRIDLDRYVAGGGWRGLESLLLDNAVQDCSYVKMPVSYEVFRRAGNPAPRSGWAHVVINDLDYGLFYLTEEIDDRFTERAWADPSAVVYDGSYTEVGGNPLFLVDFTWYQLPYFDQEEGTPEDLATVEEVTTALDEWEAGRWTYADVGTVLDWSSWLGHLAAEEWAGHVDGYLIMPNNYWLVRPADGRVRVIAWDTDQTFLYDWQWFMASRFDAPYGRVAVRCRADALCLDDLRTAMSDLVVATGGADLGGLLDRLDRLTLGAALADPRRECAEGDVSANRQVVRDWLARRNDEERAVWGL